MWRNKIINLQYELDEKVKVVKRWLHALLKSCEITSWELMRV